MRSFDYKTEYQKLLTPEIGEAAYLDGEQPRYFDGWWERMR